MTVASFGGPQPKPELQNRTEPRPPHRKEEIKLKGRDNFKLQINLDTKTNLSKVVAHQIT